MLRFVLFVTVFVVMSGAAAVGFDARCDPDAPPDVQVATCGAVIEDPAVSTDDRVLALVSRGISHVQLGDHGAGLADLDRAIGLKPDDPQLRYFRALVHLDCGELAAAIADYDWIIARVPDAENVLVSRCYAKSEAGDQWGAVVDCESALRLEPNLASAYNNMAVALHRLGLGEVALNDVGLVLGANPDHWAYLDTRAHVHLALGKPEAALADFDAAIANGGVAAVTLYQDALREKGFYDGATDGRMSEALRAALAACVDARCGLLIEAGTLPAPPEPAGDDVKAQVFDPVYLALARAGLAEDAIFLSGDTTRTLITADAAAIVVFYDAQGTAHAVVRDAFGLFDPKLTDAVRAALGDCD